MTHPEAVSALPAACQPVPSAWDPAVETGSRRNLGMKKKICEMNCK